jgi:hypothetical protein
LIIHFYREGEIDMSMTSSLASKPRSYWQDQVSKFRSSGLTQKEFCALNGIKFTTFHYWIYRKGLDLTDTENSPAFFPVKIDSRTPKRISEGDIKISLQNGIIISVTREVDIKTFRELLEVLR